MNAPISPAEFALDGFAFRLLEKDLAEGTGLDALPASLATGAVDAHDAVDPFRDGLVSAGMEAGGIFALIAVFRREDASDLPGVLGNIHAAEKVRLATVHGPAGYGAGLAADALVEIDDHGRSGNGLFCAGGMRRTGQADGRSRASPQKAATGEPCDSHHCFLHSFSP